MQIFLYNFIRKKNFYIYFLLITVCITFLITICTLFYNVSTSIMGKNDDVRNRELVISTNEDFETVYENLKDTSGIKEIYKSVYPVEAQVVIEEIISVQLKSGSIEHIPKVILGQDMQNKDKNSIILPSKLRVKNGFISCEDLLNKEISFKIYTDNRVLTYIGKVIGIYDIQNNIAENVYIPYIDLLNILYENNESESDFKSYTIIANTQKDAEKLVGVINKKGYNATLYDNTLQKETNILKIIKSIITVMIIFIMFFTYIILHTIISNMLSEDKKDLSILKSIGYKNYQILFISLFDTLFLTICSFIISIFLSRISINIISNIFSEKLTDAINLTNLTFYNMCLLLSIILLISILSNLFSIKKLKRISPILMFNAM